MTSIGIRLTKIECRAVSNGIAQVEVKGQGINGAPDLSYVGPVDLSVWRLVSHDLVASMKANELLGPESANQIYNWLKDGIPPSEGGEDDDD